MFVLCCMKVSFSYNGGLMLQFILETNDSAPLAGVYSVELSGQHYHTWRFSRTLSTLERLLLTPFCYVVLVKLIPNKDSQHDKQ